MKKSLLFPLLIAVGALSVGCTLAPTLSPPSWIIGTWSDSSAIVTWRFTSDNAIYTAGGTEIDFVSFAQSSGADLIESVTPSSYSISFGSDGVSTKYQFNLTSSSTCNYVLSGIYSIQLNKAYNPDEVEIGSSGPGGGFVFYDKGSYSDGWRYIECAPYDQQTGGVSGVVWGNAVIGVQRSDVGTGKQNTLDIIAADSTQGIAAELCTAFSIAGIDDWYLPSYSELYYMYTNLQANGIGNMGSLPTDRFYWSSTEYTNIGAYLYWFYGAGSGGATPKSELGRVRAVHYF